MIGIEKAKKSVEEHFSRWARKLAEQLGIKIYHQPPPDATVGRFLVRPDKHYGAGGQRGWSGHAGHHRANVSTGSGAAHSDFSTIHGLRGWPFILSFASFLANALQTGVLYEQGCYENRR